MNIYKFLMTTPMYRGTLNIEFTVEAESEHLARCTAFKKTIQIQKEEGLMFFTGGEWRMLGTVESHEYNKTLIEI